MNGITITAALADPHLLGRHLQGASWAPWRAVLAATLAEPLDDAELDLWQRVSGRTTAPTVAAREAWWVVGRRGGKSFAMGLFAVFLACFRDYRSRLAPGEVATVMLIAADRRQARVLMRYVAGITKSVPMLAEMVETERTWSLDFTNRVVIEVHTADFRRTRGYTVAAALLDEVSFWPSDSESASPDTEVVAALRPALSTLDGVLIGASSPYRRAGVLWESFRDHHGHDGDPVQVIQAPTRTMNPALPERIVEDAIKADPASAAAEYLGEFRSDLAPFLPSEWIDAALRDGSFDLPHDGAQTYLAFADPSGGARDAFTLAIAHHDRSGHLIVDALRIRPAPFKPQAVVEDFARLCAVYRVRRVVGDAFGGSWVSDTFVEAGIVYKPAGASKSEIYMSAEPLFAAGRVSLPGDPTLAHELRNLVRRTARGGRDSVDHPPRGHDDAANAVAGALWLAHEAGAGVELGPEHWGSTKQSPIIEELVAWTARDVGGLGFAALDARRPGEGLFAAVDRLFPNKPH